MMLLEDQGKNIFRDYGIDVPSGRTVTSAEQADDMLGTVMVKALVPAGGRGRGGGVKKTSGAEETMAAVGSLLGATISGHEVRSVLVEDAIDAAREMYISIIIDRSLGIPVLMASRTGGVAVESLDDSMLQRWPLHPFLDVPRYVVRELGAVLDLEGRQEDLYVLLTKLWRLFKDLDCELVEINPFMLSGNGLLIAADAKIAVNDDAVYRHPELSVPASEDEMEEAARREGFSFLRLDGDIGVIANGAGLTMATMDSLSAHGGRAGAFMDLGGTDDPKRVRRAFELMVRSGQKIVMVNIFGGITRCDTVAQGLLEAMDGMASVPPTVVRLRGVNEEVARDMLRARGISARAELKEAIIDAVSLEARA